MSSSDWVEFWDDSKNPIYVDARHEAAHFRRIAEDIRYYAPEDGIPKVAIGLVEGEEAE